MLQFSAYLGAPKTIDFSKLKCTEFCIDKAVNGLLNPQKLIPVDMERLHNFPILREIFLILREIHYCCELLIGRLLQDHKGDWNNFRTFLVDNFCLDKLCCSGQEVLLLTGSHANDRYILAIIIYCM